MVEAPSRPPRTAPAGSAQSVLARRSRRKVPPMGVQLTARPPTQLPRPQAPGPAAAEPARDGPREPSRVRARSLYVLRLWGRIYNIQHPSSLRLSLSSLGGHRTA